MASYKINGYSLELAFGFYPDQDKTTADSFESMPDVVPGFQHDWGDVIEYDLLSPTYYKPKVLTIKGNLVVDTLDDYMATRMAIETVLYQNYVTLEQIETELKYNAKLRPGGNSWHRLTNLSDTKIIVAVQFQFDELKQTAAFKDEGNLNITYLVDSQMRYYNTQDNKFIIT